MANTPGSTALSKSPPEGSLRWALQNAEEALRGLAFGTVTLVVQDGVVVQVERTERRRFHRPSEER
jgi:hypothetical protein